MTTINWERTSGELVEEFVAAHLLLRSGIGNLIRPSQGDGGIDVKIPTPEGWEIYQIKRFAQNLDSSQKRQITESWSRFQQSGLASKGVKFWALVLPLDPTPQNLTWFENLTTGSGIVSHWIGRATLDGWAAENPKLTDYFFGDGNRRTLELLASVVSTVNPAAAQGGEALLDSVGARLAGLSDLLDEVDPFYRYELEVKTGSINEPPSADLVTDSVPSNRVMTTIQEVNDRQCLYTHVIARSAMSTTLRPVTGRFNMSATTPEEAEALELWALYGAPLKAARGRILSSEGPPGTTSASGAELTAWTFSPVDAEPLPPLEVRLLDPEGEVLRTVAVTKAEQSTGVIGDGRWIAVDLGPGATLEFYTGATGRADGVKCRITEAFGEEPNVALAGMELMANLHGNTIQLAVQGGLAYVPAVTVAANAVTARLCRAAALRARWFRALTVVQKHVLVRVTIPDMVEVPREHRETFTQMAEVLAQGFVESRLQASPVGDDPAFAALSEDPQPFVTEFPVAFAVGAQVWDTGMSIRREFESVVLDRSVSPAVLRPGNSDRVIEHAVPRGA